jgi:putative flippase GtrA
MRKQIKTLFAGKTNQVLIQLFRYTFVGGFAFLVDFGLLFLLKEICGLHYILSASLSFIAGLFVNYIISIYWVFTSSKNQNRKLEFLYFGIIGLIGLGFNDLFMWLFTDKIHFHYLFSKIVAAILVYLWNFFARKYLLFNTKTIQNEQQKEC